MSEEKHEHKEETETPTEKLGIPEALKQILKNQVDIGQKLEEIKKLVSWE